MTQLSSKAVGIKVNLNIKIPAEIFHILLSLLTSNALTLMTTLMLPTFLLDDTVKYEGMLDSQMIAMKASSALIDVWSQNST